MLRYLLDTDCCIYLLAGGAGALSRRLGEQTEGTVGISIITLAELAVKYRDVPDGLAGLLEELPVQPFDEAAAWAYGRLPFKRGSYDRLIAAHALSLGLTLVTNNERDFANVEGLRIENWARP